MSTLPRRNCRILCVDDDLNLLEALQDRLSAAGYAVDVAPNGFRAFTTINANLDRYRVVITDIRMPGLDGYGLIEQSRAVGFAGPFIIYAASMTPDHRQRLRELNVAQVIEKPVPTTTLLDALRQAHQGF
jgi:Response regulator containing CheY-like receiver, AAA-type ATPase, and DNA-binding domains